MTRATCSSEAVCWHITCTRHTRRWPISKEKIAKRTLRNESDTSVPTRHTNRKNNTTNPRTSTTCEMVQDVSFSSQSVLDANSDQKDHNSGSQLPKMPAQNGGMSSEDASSKENNILNDMFSTNGHAIPRQGWKNFTTIKKQIIHSQHKEPLHAVHMADSNNRYETRNNCKCFERQRFQHVWDARITTLGQLPKFYLKVVMRSSRES